MALLEWLRGQRGTPPSDGEKPAGSDREIGAAPGIASLIEGLSRDEERAVLDLGPANEVNLSVYSQFARHVRFADLLPPDGEKPVEWREALSFLTAESQPRYDLLLAWNTLDRLFPEQRAGLVARLAELAAPGAHLHVIVEMSDSLTVHAHGFSFAGSDRMAYHRSAPGPRVRTPLLPGEVERLLEPFEVVRAFTLKAGFREYVARLGRGSSSSRRSDGAPRRAWRPA